jgi:hypothetical protein
MGNAAFLGRWGGPAPYRRYIGGNPDCGAEHSAFYWTSAPTPLKRTALPSCASSTSHRNDTCARQLATFCASCVLFYGGAELPPQTGPKALPLRLRGKLQRWNPWGFFYGGAKFAAKYLHETAGRSGQMIRYWSTNPDASRPAACPKYYRLVRSMRTLHSRRSINKKLGTSKGSAGILWANQIGSSCSESPCGRMPPDNCPRRSR